MFNDGLLKMSPAHEHDDFEYLYCPLFSTFSTHYFTIAFKKIDSKFWVYGFSVRETLDQSLEQSLAELNRNRHVLTKFYTQNSVTKLRLTLADPNIFYVERRLLFFSTHEGYSLFKNLLEKATQAQGSLGLKQPTPILSTPVDGLWTKYAIVWRTIIDGDYRKRMDHNLIEYFHF